MVGGRWSSWLPQRKGKHHFTCLHTRHLFGIDVLGLLSCHRYYKDKKKLQEEMDVPQTWTDGAWEVFIKFGTPGLN